MMREAESNGTVKFASLSISYAMFFSMSIMQIIQQINISQEGLFTFH